MTYKIIVVLFSETSFFQFWYHLKQQKARLTQLRLSILFPVDFECPKFHQNWLLM